METRRTHPATPDGSEEALAARLMEPESIKGKQHTSEERIAGSSGSEEKHPKDELSQLQRRLHDVFSCLAHTSSACKSADFIALIRDAVESTENLVGLYSLKTVCTAMQTLFDHSHSLNLEYVVVAILSLGSIALKVHTLPEIVFEIISSLMVEVQRIQGKEAMKSLYQKSIRNVQGFLLPFY